MYDGLRRIPALEVVQFASFDLSYIVSNELVPLEGFTFASVAVARWLNTSGFSRGKYFCDVLVG